MALNDIVLNRGVFSQVAAYSVSRQGFGNICSFTADGIILATATGSTAYSLSAGGPILEPQLECVAVTPICPHLIGARSSIVSLQEPLVVHFKPKEDSEVHVFVDGVAKFSGGCELELLVRRSKLKARLINPLGFDFSGRVEKKLTHKKF